MKAEVYKKLIEGKDPVDVAMIDLLINFDRNVERIANAVERLADIDEEKTS